jgi:putative DNA primase/helicase
MRSKWKRLGAAIIKGLPILSLDNSEVDIGGAAMCQVVERPRISLRVLGYSELPEFDCRTTVYSNGNNVGVRGDMVRRTLICDLDRGVERPELHAFAKNPIEMVRENRGAYIAAALTIVRAYIRAGSPVPDKYVPLGSYGQWCRMVRLPLLWLGQQDPVISMNEARKSDPVLANIRQLFTSGWLKEGQPYRARDIMAKAETDTDLQELLERVAGDEQGKVSSRRLGNWLSNICGRVVEGYRLNDYDIKQNVVRYYLELVPQD